MMWSLRTAFAVCAVYLSCSASAAALNSVCRDDVCRPLKSACRATSDWPGFSGLKHAFIFGDSYTTTGFNQTLQQPTRTNPLGNPTFPGNTASDGPNWVDYLTVEYNASKLLTYNLAFGGATMNSTLVAPFMPTVSSIADQVDNEWIPTYSSKPSDAPWSSDDTLFAIFDGINDVGNSWFLSTTASLNNEIFAVFRTLVTELYNAGARNFAFLNVPPIDRAPEFLALTADQQAMVKADLQAWNTQLLNVSKTLKSSMRNANFFTVDTNSLFTTVLDNPASFPQTALYKNTTSFCVAYENGTVLENTFVPSCGVPVNEYFWLNSLHPTFPMHNVLAQAVAQQLEAGPNVC